MSSTFGGMLREQRRILGITIVELAEMIGVSQAYISRIELEEIKPVKEQMEVIESFLQIIVP